MSALIYELSSTIAARRNVDPEHSYTALLLNDLPKAAQKVGEEAVEVVIAALQHDRAQMIYESADLVYHLLVLLEAKGIEFTEVEAELRSRQQKSK